MKKTLVLVLIVLMAATAFGQISQGAWGRGVLAIGSRPLDGDASVGLVDTKSWGGSGSRVGYTVSGNSDMVGFQLAFDYDGTNEAVGLANIWAKPIDMVKFTIGTYNNHKLRGNAEFGAWNWFRFAPGNPKGGQYSLGPNNRWSNDSVGEDTTFARNAGRSSFLVELEPMEGLYIFAAPLSGPDGGGAMTQIWESTTTTTTTTAADEYGLNTATGVIEVVTPAGTTTTTTTQNYGTMLNGADFVGALKAGQYGFGYDIAGIGQIKAQYIGVETDVDDADLDAWINAAFKLTAVEGLMAEVGIFAPTADDIMNNPNEDVTQIAAYAKYSGVAGMTVHAGGTVWMFKDLMWQGALGLDYRINDDLMLNSDVRLYNEERNGELNKDNEKQLGWGVSANVSKGLGSGKVGAGIEVTNVAFANGAINGVDNGEVIFAIPVILEYWF